MSKLIVNPGTPDAWEIPLKVGSILLGRDTSNDVPIDHPSVSDRHCEVRMTEAMVTIRDLESSAGTLVDGVPVNEERLRNGQSIRLGDVELRFQSNAAPQVPARAPVPGVEAEADRHCKIHREVYAGHKCPSCGSHYCDLCVSRRMERNVSRAVCRACGVVCVSVPLPVRPAAAPDKTYAQLLPGAFVFPFLGHGAILLIAGAVFFTLLAFVAQFASIMSLVLMLGATGYMISYYQAILLASANGEDRMPDWPDFTDWQSLFGPLVQFLGAFLVSFGPCILIRMFAPQDAGWKTPAFDTTLGIGFVVFPMAFMVVSMADSLAALNPLVVVSSIVKIAPAYILLLVVFGLTLGADWLGNALLARIGYVPLLSGMLYQLMVLYLVAVMMRATGLLYRCRKDQLQWFSQGR
jgi:hypothetical protein